MNTEEWELALLGESGVGKTAYIYYLYKFLEQENLLRGELDSTTLYYLKNVEADMKISGEPSATRKEADLHLIFEAPWRQETEDTVTNRILLKVSDIEGETTIFKDNLIGKNIRSRLSKQLKGYLFFFNPAKNLDAYHQLINDFLHEVFEERKHNYLPIIFVATHIDKLDLSGKENLKKLFNDVCSRYQIMMDREFGKNNYPSSLVDVEFCAAEVISRPETREKILIPLKKLDFILKEREKYQLRNLQRKIFAGSSFVAILLILMLFLFLMPSDIWKNRSYDDLFESSRKLSATDYGTDSGSRKFLYILKKSQKEYGKLKGIENKELRKKLEDLQKDTIGQLKNRIEECGSRIDQKIEIYKMYSGISNYLVSQATSDFFQDLRSSDLKLKLKKELLNSQYNGGSPEEYYIALGNTINKVQKNIGDQVLEKHPSIQAQFNSIQNFCEKLGNEGIPLKIEVKKIEYFPLTAYKPYLVWLEIFINKKKLETFKLKPEDAKNNVIEYIVEQVVIIPKWKPSTSIEFKISINEQPPTLIGKINIDEFGQNTLTSLKKIKKDFPFAWVPGFYPTVLNSKTIDFHKSWSMDITIEEPLEVPVFKELTK